MVNRPTSKKMKTEREKEREKKREREKERERERGLAIMCMKNERFSYTAYHWKDEVSTVA